MYVDVFLSVKYICTCVSFCEIIYGQLISDEVLIPLPPQKMFFYKPVGVCGPNPQSESEAIILSPPISTCLLHSGERHKKQD